MYKNCLYTCKLNVIQWQHRYSKINNYYQERKVLSARRRLLVLVLVLGLGGGVGGGEGH